MSKIWERYFARELLKVLVLFLFSFFFLYACIDCSLHMEDFVKDSRIQILDVVVYYCFQFIKRASLLVPLALLVAAIKVLYSFNIHKELVALQVAGLKFKKLMRPLFIVATLCMLFNYAATEFLLPPSMNYLDRFYDKHFKRSREGGKKHPIRTLTLKDRSKLLYQSYDKAHAALFDVIWLQSSDEVWRIKYLSLDQGAPTGSYIDHLIRNKEGFFEKSESFDKRSFPEIKWQKDLPRKGFIPLENKSLSQLFRLSFHKEKLSVYEKREAATQFWYKAMMPLLSLLVLIACTPFCVQYARKIPLFFIYTIALFGYIAFCMLLNASVILGENQILSPAIAIFIPFTLCSTFFVWKFAKTR